MKRKTWVGAGLTVLATIFVARAVKGVDSDPYAPLKLYDGNWEVRVSVPEPKVDHLVNHCAQTGLFYSCEQVVNGKSSALVVFLPIGKTSSGALEYRTQALLASASAAGEWGHLVIDGDKWLYAWDNGDAKKVVHWRVTNHFTGKEKIHFEVQNSEDGITWKTQTAGDEEHQHQSSQP
jgi:hypothetical protein